MTLKRPSAGALGTLAVLFGTAFLTMSLPARADSDTAQLVVGDPSADHLYVYGVPSMRKLADFAGIALGVHAGTIPLADGRVLIADEDAKQLVILKTGIEQPAILARIPMPIPLGDRYGWTAIDPTGRYVMATSDDDDEAVELLTVVDLQTAKAHQFRVDVGAPDAEFGVTIGGDPAMVAFHLTDRVDQYSLADLVKAGAQLNDIVDGKLKPTQSLPVGKGGHSGSVSTATGMWMASTLRGLELAKIENGKLADAKVLSWDRNDLSGGRNARQRLTVDGRFEFGPLNATVTPDHWADTENDLHWVDLASQTASRTVLAKGIVGRGGVSKTLAVYASVHPDGDVANLVDVDPASAKFRQVVARVPLDTLSHAPVAGASPATAESRYAAITPDGRYAFVTNGGDGTISVIDTGAAKATGKITVPTPLKGGGYVVAVAPGMPISELSGR
jgi:YVTN family beta-propeller protein